MDEPRAPRTARGSRFERIGPPMTEPTMKDRGLAPRVIAYMQSRPGQLVSVEELEKACGADGEPARRPSIQNVVNRYVHRSPDDVQVVSSGLAWIWRGKPADASAAPPLIVIRVLADESLLCEGPGGKLYRAKEVQW